MFIGTQPEIDFRLGWVPRKFFRGTREYSSTGVSLF